MLREQIKEKRKGLKITQAQMAKHLGITRNGYIRLESIGKTISFDQIDTICHVLGLRVDLISSAEYEAKNALKSNPAFWMEKLREFMDPDSSLRSTKTTK
jgi:transcriptional regulator with XRE-family HTH domain